MNPVHAAQAACTGFAPTESAIETLGILPGKGEATGTSKETIMSNENRVFSRQKAREVSQDELKLVSGNGTTRTLTGCTFDEQLGKDGDTNEC